MTDKNKSTAYGNYGGVRTENHYVPPAVEDFVPLPSKSLIFTAADRELLEELRAAADFVEENSKHILLRVKTDSQPGNVDTFVFTTSGSDDTITYTSNEDKVVLDDLAGDGVTSNSVESIDGGFF